MSEIMRSPGLPTEKVCQKILETTIPNLGGGFNITENICVVIILKFSFAYVKHLIGEQTELKYSQLKIDTRMFLFGCTKCWGLAIKRFFISFHGQKQLVKTNLARQEWCKLT